MRLSRVFIDHFKGLDKLDVAPEGKNITVRGKNGSGKTTIADAYAWCMTGKGFDGKVIDTQIKKRAADGSTPNDGGVEHAVEIVLDDDGRQIVLRREFKEKWEKHRGQAEREFKGHTTVYSIDGVPMAKKEFERRVSDLVKGDTFQLLSMPLHFCTNVKWQDRRKVLMTMCGETPDEQIIADNPKLEPLKVLLQNKIISDVRKVIQSKMKKNNDESRGIPARIDELTQMQGEAKGNKSALETEIRSLEKQKADKQKELVRIQNGGEVAEANKRIAELKAKMTTFAAQFEADYNRKAGEAERTVNGCRAEIERIGAGVERAQTEIERLRAFADTQDKIAADLRTEWSTVHAEEFAENVDDTCPCCGQKLPADKIDELIDKAREKFNLDKAARLKAIQEKGKRIMADKEKDLKKATALEDSNKENLERIDELTAKLQEAQKMLDGIEKPDYKAEPEYITMAEEVATTEKMIESLQAGGQEETRKVETEIENLGNEISVRQEKLAAIKQNEGIEERIEELKDREKTLGLIYNNLEKQLFLTEEFLRAKVRATEDNINSHFKYVQWKMFEQKINGALDECCEPIIDGVPFNDGLNKGNRMKAALDIVNALSKYYGVSLPIFIDDCESYTSLPEVDAQLIKLIADGDHDSLEVEIEA
ncbi:MAG: AAA family ATPase [Selenomonas sp.]|uniref:AAA family ATPase n=1 Tax=Selenomonas sp. TaxID=2053611 RepID=UPI0025F35FAE|nr:AAA family ATPase [Selenomonas sp.]MCR5440235.1 AAA family ATPase [Selenomonas sp.]